MRDAYNVKYKVLGAFRHLLVPLVRILIRNGVGVQEFSQVVKEVYARVCIRDFGMTAGGESEKKVSPARISIVTGLTRSEVNALLAEDGPLGRSMQGNEGRIANLLQGWHTDPEFVGPYGVPRDLFIDTDPLGLQTFTELVRRYGSGGTREEVLNELVRIDAALVPPTGEPIRVVKRTYIPESTTPDVVEVFARGVRRYAETVDHNLQNSGSTYRLFERSVFPDDGIQERDWETFHNLVSERLQDLVRELDTKFAWFESPQTTGAEPVSVGVGLYVYRDSKDNQQDWDQLRGKTPVGH